MKTSKVRTSVFSNNSHADNVTNFATGSATNHSGIAIGQDAKVASSFATAIGTSAHAFHDNMISIGTGAGALVSSTTPTTGAGSINIGCCAGINAGDNCINIGHLCGYRRPGSTTYYGVNRVIHDNLEVSGTDWGGGTPADNTICIGKMAYASHSNTICIGHATTSTAASTLNLPSGYTIHASWQQISTSDDRLKHNEALVTDGLDVLRQLQPKVYQKTRSMFMTDDNGTEIVDVNGERTPYGPDYNSPLDGEAGGKWEWECGFVAQEVAQIPSLRRYVSEHTDPDRLWGLNYDALFSYCVGAVKELDGVVQQQQSTIDALLARVSALEAA